MPIVREGKYRAKIEDYGVFESAYGQQYPTVFVRFRLIGRYSEDSPDSTEECPPESREYTKAITEKTIKWVLLDLKQIGFDKEKLLYLNPEETGAPDLFGREVDVTCEHEEYEGKTRERWSFYGEKKRKRVDRDVLSRLDSQHGEAIRRVLGPKKGNTVPPPSPSDDVAF